MAGAFCWSESRNQRAVASILKVVEYFFGCLSLATGIFNGGWARNLARWYAGQVIALLGFVLANLIFFKHLFVGFRFYCFVYLQLEVGIMDIFDHRVQITCCNTLFLRVYVRLRHRLNMIFDHSLQKSIISWQNYSNFVWETLRQLLIHCDFVLQ